jgi:hypothetical protein
MIYLPLTFTFVQLTLIKVSLKKHDAEKIIGLHSGISYSTIACLASRDSTVFVFISQHTVSRKVI